MLHELFTALEATLFMVFISGLLSLFFGILLALGLMQLSKQHNASSIQKLVYRTLSGLVETFATLPYLAFAILLVPFSRKLLGTDTGIMASIFSLTLIGLFPFACLCEKSLIQQQRKFQDLARSLGANPWQSLYKIYLKQSFPDLARGFSQILTQLLGYSVIAGVFGAGGLGGLLIEKGYQNFQWSYVLICIALLIIMIQGIKYSMRFWIRD